MTSRAVCLTCVASVIEHRVETLKPGKSLDVSRRVTNRTDRTRIPFRELLRVTRCTRYVPRHFQRRRFVVSDVTYEARQTRVLLSVMAKPREVLSRCSNFGFHHYERDR